MTQDTSDRDGHVPFLRSQVEIDPRVQNLITSLVLELNLIESLGGNFKHSQLTITVRGDYVVLPPGFHGIEGSSKEDKKRFCGNPRYQ